MPEIRCPMCSKANDDRLATCAHCGARLSPLVIEPGSDDLPADPPQEDMGEQAANGAPGEQGPDWLGRLRSTSGPSEKADRPAPKEADDVPDWIDRLRPPRSIGTDDEADEIPEADEEKGEAEWLDRLREIESPGLESEGGHAATDSPAESEDRELVRAEIPEWLQVTRQDESDDAPLDELEDAIEAEADDVATSDLEARAELRDPLSIDLDEEAPPIEEAEDYGETFEEVEEEPGAEAPQVEYVPALVFDEEPFEDDSPDLDLESIRIPEWLSDDRKADPERDETPKEETPEIARATLPEWLAAMRPIETFRTQEEDDEAEPKDIETVGPLAGLSDVLVAEPVVAMPRTPGVMESSISVTQQETEQMRILRKLVAAEQQDITAAQPRKRAAPILHWVIAFLMVAAVLLPMFFEADIFPPPRWVPQDLGTLRGIVEELPNGRPALVVTDYDPGYSAELEAVSSSLVDQLFQRGMSVVTLSTRAAGPALAQRLIDRVAAWRAVSAGEDYLHLGYLAGGPTAVQLFASNPQYGNVRGFMLPEDREWTSPWESPILSGVQLLSDFGAVIVITAGTETARTWAEQAAPHTGASPFIMVLSAGAEPLVRPYYANPDPQVDAIFTGLPSAVANELLSDRSGSAAELWDAFGTGGWAATGILLAGGVLGVLSSVFTRRGKDVGDD